MIIAGLFMSVFIQCLSYWIIDSYKIRFSKLWILLLMIIVWLFVLPQIAFNSEFGDEQVRCGLPVLAMYVAFWIFGGGLTLLTHICYVITNKILKGG